MCARVYIYIYTPHLLLEKEMAAHSRILENSMDRGAWWATVHGVVRVRNNLAIKPPPPPPHLLYPFIKSIKNTESLSHVPETVTVL